LNYFHCIFGLSIFNDDNQTVLQLHTKFKIDNKIGKHKAQLSVYKHMFCDGDTLCTSVTVVMLWVSTAVTGMDGYDRDNASFR